MAARSSLTAGDIKVSRDREMSSSVQMYPEIERCPEIEIGSSEINSPYMYTISQDSLLLLDTFLSRFLATCGGGPYPGIFPVSVHLPILS
jgi:hypothetical protein